ncbi:hypothetical protein JHD50_04710 [Sulfurimonas sp. MAG313]|nr:hypothetical protein [Sulfurimonas sp. MAG313]MDF1880609.1 hypothetical protein [Sulfurimonas sp. MAG313]
MKPLIDYIQTALSQTTSLDEAVNFLPQSFQKNFLVSYVHSNTRIKNPDTKKAFEKILDKKGLTPQTPSLETRAFIQAASTKVQQCVSYMCLNKAQKEPLLYKTKNTHDYWKKIQDVSNMKAVFDIASKKGETPCESEISLREVIRKRKEVHQLKELGFIWLSESKEDLEPLFKHYFKDKYLIVNKKYYIGYAKILKDINMRYFFCQDEAIDSYTIKKKKGEKRNP